MRRASTCLALVGLVVFALAGVASAAPVVTLKAQPVAIPGFPHTGNHKGAGAAAQAEFTISGTEYAGFPPPLIGVNFFLPTGSKINSKGFKKCSVEALKNTGPKACPKGSAAGNSMIRPNAASSGKSASGWTIGRSCGASEASD